MARGEVMPVHRKITEQWELLCGADKAELYRVRKEHPDGSSYIIFYKGLSYVIADDGSRIANPATRDFKAADEGKEWFFRHK
jgi:hypothetical protein